MVLRVLLADEARARGAVASGVPAKPAKPKPGNEKADPIKHHFPFFFLFIVATRKIPPPIRSTVVQSICELGTWYGYG